MPICACMSACLVTYHTIINPSHTSYHGIYTIHLCRRNRFTTWRHWTKHDAPLKSGLIGPVRLRFAEKAK